MPPAAVTIEPALRPVSRLGPRPLMLGAPKARPAPPAGGLARPVDTPRPVEIPVALAAFSGERPAPPAEPGNGFVAFGGAAGSVALGLAPGKPEPSAGIWPTGDGVVPAGSEAPEG